MIITKRTKLPFEDRWQEINCLLPIYDKDGANCTRIVFSTQEEDFIDRRTIRGALRALSRAFAVDLDALRRRYGSLVNRKVSLPLPLHPRLILVPFKYRIPQWKDQGSWGYFSLDKISGYRRCSEEGKTEIIFTCGKKEIVLLDAISVKKLLNDAQIVRVVYNNHLNPSGGGKVRECAFQEYHCPSEQDSEDELTT